MIKKIKVGDKEVEIEFVKGAVRTVFRPYHGDPNLQWSVDLILDDGGGYWSYSLARCPNKYMADRIAGVFKDENIDELFDKLRERVSITDTGNEQNLTD